MLLGSIFRQVTRDPITYRRVDTSSLAGVQEASRPPNIFTDLQMGLGLIPEDSSYRSRTERNILRQRMAARSRNDNDDSPPPSKPKGPSAAEIALAKRKAEGQAARKKFEKEKGEKRIALRKRYLKLLKLA